MKYVFVLLFLSSLSFGQAWSGIIAPARAMDWSGAGVPGGIPNLSVPCATQPLLTVGSSNATANTNAINAAIISCDLTHNVVNLPAGTFFFAGVDFAATSNVVVRGAGANGTFLIATAGSLVNCNGAPSLFCAYGHDSTFWIPGTGINWTSGYSQGTNTITLSSTTGVIAGKLIVLNECDTGFSGVSCGTGSSVDNLGYFNAGTICNSNGTKCLTGASLSGPDMGNGTPLRFQAELFNLTGVNTGTNVAFLNEGLKHPNWASGLTPQAWVVTPISNVGIENLSIDSSADSSVQYAITFFSSTNSWVKGVRILSANIGAFTAFISNHFTVQDSYFYETQGSDSHAISLHVTSNGLVQNNIWHQMIDPIVIEGDDTGTVFGYNLSIGNCNYLAPQANCSSDGLTQMARPHSNGVDFELYEGNMGTSYDSDGDHGTALSQTLYRNFFTGWESCGVSNVNLAVVNTSGTAVTWVSGGTFLTGPTWNGLPIHIVVGGNSTPFVIASVTDSTHLILTASAGTNSGVAAGTGPCGPTNNKDFLTNPLIGYGYVTRYHNMIANVFGTPTIHTTYQYINGVLDNSAVYGLAGPVSSGVPPYDPIVLSTLFRWGNYDTANATVLFCTGVSTPISACTADERGTSAPTYPGLTSPSTTLPASFYLGSTKPSWFGSTPYPAIGPDVSGGDMGQCAGTKNVTGQFNLLPSNIAGKCVGSTLTTPSYGGHVNGIPALNCYLNVMGGTLDGTGYSPLTFNANTCYGVTATIPTPNGTSGVIF